MSECTTKREGPITWLTLDRPKARNALSPSLLQEIIETCEALQQDAETRVVVLRGAGGVFSAGADLMGFMEMLQQTDEAALLTADLGRLAAEAIAALPQVTIAAIEGYCVGGGVVLAAACDLRWAAAGCWFSVPELALGVPLGWGGMARLVALVGESRAAEWVLGCERIPLEEAQQSGFVTAQLTTTAETPIDAALKARVEEIAARPLGALRTTKQQLIALRAGTFAPKTDAAALLRALRDPESLQAAQRYITRRVGPS